MSDWSRSVYGDPCRECGFEWSRSLDEAVSVVTGLPESYGALLAGATGKERHPGLSWSSGEYVSHVGDNLRIWAERLVGATGGGPVVVGGYSERELAQARNYRSIPLAAALWSLGRSVADWRTAVGRSPRTGIVLVHPERGGQSLGDVALSNAHDGFHHRWDIARTLESARE